MEKKPKTFNAYEISWAEITPPHVVMEWGLNHTSLKSMRLSLIRVICLRRKAQTAWERDLWTHIRNLISNAMTEKIRNAPQLISCDFKACDDNPIFYGIHFSDKKQQQW